MHTVHRILWLAHLLHALAAAIAMCGGAAEGADRFAFGVPAETRSALVRRLVPQALPDPVIDGPASAEPGDLVVLSAERSSGHATCWVAINLEPGRWLEIENGRKLVFATGKPGRYSFVLVAASLIEGTVIAETARHDVVIGTPPDPPPPGPEPGPEPQPQPLPDGKYQLAAAARDWAGQIPAAARGKASALAGAFDSVAAQIAAGVLTEFAAVTAAMRAAKDAALGADATAWTPFFESLDTRLGQLWDAEQLTTVADMATAFRELATGLRAVNRR